MAITAYSITRIGDVTTITVTSDLAAPIGYHWYADGDYLGVTTEPSLTLALDVGEQVDLECVDTDDPDFDPATAAPAGYPARKTLWWVRSLDADVSYYRIDQQQDGGDWAEVAIVQVEPGGWSYQWRSGRLDDLSQYAWRIVPVDRAGNDGTPLEIGPERVVRRPDAPDFGATFDDNTGRVTIAAA